MVVEKRGRKGIERFVLSIVSVSVLVPVACDNIDLTENQKQIEF